MWPGLLPMSRNLIGGGRNERERKGCVTFRRLQVDRLFWRRHLPKFRQEQLDQLRRDVETSNHEAILKSVQSMYLLEAGSELRRTLGEREWGIQKMRTEFAEYYCAMQEREVGVYDRVVQMEARAEGEHGRILSEAASEISFLRDSLRHAESVASATREESAREREYLRRVGQGMGEQLAQERNELQQSCIVETGLRRFLGQQATEARQAELSRQAEFAQVENSAANAMESLKLGARRSEATDRQVDWGEKHSCCSDFRQ